MNRILVMLATIALVAVGTAGADRGGGSAVGAASLVVHDVFGLQTLELRDFDFAVKARPDGSAVGLFNYREVDDGTPFNAVGSLWCLTVIGNEAWIGGTILRSSDPTYVGLGGWWHVVDNGQGRDAQPDITTFMGAGTIDETHAFCDTHPPFKHPFAIQAGNIVVRTGPDR
jgi:hypothetical protein